MAQLAIKRHATRGREVIELLEMLGGENINRMSGDMNGLVYIITSEGEIDCFYSISNIYKVFTLEEFIEKYPYKVGDKVKYNNNIFCIKSSQWDSEKNTVIYYIDADWSAGYVVEANNLQPYKEEIVEGVYYNGEINCYHQDFGDKVRVRLGDEFEIKVEDGKTYVVRKKSQYPKTFIEVLNFWHPDRQPEDDYQRCYKKDIIEKFQDLLYARSAYWKIAGEEIGLGKAWKRDYDDRCFIIANNNGNIHTYEYHGSNNVILAFPTEEMRDTFYENFRNEIEQCKEFL